MSPSDKRMEDQRGEGTDSRSHNICRIQIWISVLPAYASQLYGSQSQIGFRWPSQGQSLVSGGHNSFPGPPRPFFLWGRSLPQQLLQKICRSKSLLHFPPRSYTLTEMLTYYTLRVPQSFPPGTSLLSGSGRALRRHGAGAFTDSVHQVA